MPPIDVASNGSIKLLATDYYAPKLAGKPANIRAYADYDKDASCLNLNSGLFASTIDQGNNMEPYQGITPIIDSSLSKSAENYFFQSEQILAINLFEEIPADAVIPKSIFIHDLICLAISSGSP